MSIPRPSRQAAFDLARQLDIMPQRKAGQNFLISPGVVDDMIESAQLSKKDTVLEIGPGFGWLTDAIVKSADKVIAVEIEKRFIPWLDKELPKKVTVIHNDIFKVDLTKYLPDGKYTLMSLLPYNITGKVFRQFMTIAPRPKKIVMVIQKEVAQRMMAKPGGHNKLSLLIQRYSKIEIINEIAASSFWPKPKVQSALVLLELNNNHDPNKDKLFWRLVSIGFSSKRKTLINNLTSGYKIDKKQAIEWIIRSNLDLKIRPQALKMTEWDKLLGVISS